MKKSIIIIHGWADKPTTGWINWLTNKLSRAGYDVVAPQMPNPVAPKIKDWVAAIDRASRGRLNRRTVLIGHSLGCFALMRFLESKPSSLRVGKLILVAGFSLPKDKKVVKFFLPEPNYSKIRTQVKYIYSVYSGDDKFVPKSASLSLNQSLGGRAVRDRGKGHFIGQLDTKELPSVYKLAIKPESKFGRLLIRLKKLYKNIFFH